MSNKRLLFISSLSFWSYLGTENKTKYYNKRHPYGSYIGNCKGFRRYVPETVDEDHIFLIHSGFSCLIWLKGILLLELLNDV